ncbi:MAG: cellulose binding domain-containing protein [Pseudomonadota bacterium]
MPTYSSPLSTLDVNVRDSWDTGMVVDMTLSADTAVPGWTLAFQYTGDIVNIWNAEIVSQTGDTYVVRGMGDMSSVPAGGSTSFGFQGSGASTEIIPLTLNDVAFDGVDVTPAPMPEMPMDDTPDMPMDDMGDDHTGHDHGGMTSGDYIDITTFGSFHGSSSHTEHQDLEGGRTAITTEALEAYNDLRGYFGLDPLGMTTVGQWAFDNQLTNNTQAYGDDLSGVGLYYAMQGAKVGWIRDDAFDPQILADIQRTARLGDPADVLAMVEAYGHDGFAEYLTANDLFDTFLNTLKMEPHYGGWMHGRVHGGLVFPDGSGARSHDVNHLTVLSHDQTEPFMNDTFDWPQWSALEVPEQDVIDYFQAMVTLGDPLGNEIPAGTVGPAPTPTPPSDPAPVEPEPDPVEDAHAGVEAVSDLAATIAAHAASHAGMTITPDGTGEAMGGAGGELIQGDGGSNQIYAAGGSDIVLGGGGTDEIDGGARADELSGEGGDDRIFGGHGFDTISGGEGDDWLNGGIGRDTIYGGGGNDVLIGNGLQDLLMGGAGDDDLRGGAREDVLIADAGSDTLRGERGADHFVFDEALGAEVAAILDFDASLDFLVLGSESGADALATFLAGAVQSGSDVVYTAAGGATLTITDTDLSAFDADHFATLADAFAML